MNKKTLFYFTILQAIQISCFSTMFDSFTDTKSVLCKDKKIIALFQELQDELKIFPYLELYVVQNNPFEKELNNATAYYTSNTQAVTIVSSKFKFLPTHLKKYVLCHELRHHLQLTNNAIYQEALELSRPLKLTIQQALEHDADSFAIKHVTKNCPYCIRNIKRILRPTPRTDSKYKGYFTNEDFDNLLNDKNNCTHCNKHKTILQKTVYWLIATAFYL